ncbi:MAG TPA: transcriptional regulator NrdR [Gammaproteobacteria bacterium]|nr:transcriptional regulator NrdR [Gammaproteobacteria bacterium]
MHCPFCRHTDTKVIDSRLAGEGEQIRRRRECLDCGERFTTYESAELNMPRLVKRDGRREGFDEEKLRRGVLFALEKRPVKTEHVEQAINQVKKRLMSSGDKEINTRRLGDWVMDELLKLDQVAYIRFASVYLSFEDMDAFRETIEQLEQGLSPEARRHQIPLIDPE